MPQIRVLLGYQQGHVFCLRDEPVAIGRDPKSGIVLHPDSAASRRHAEIFALNGHWRVRDLGSVNGTSVNGRRVKDEVLRDKDEVVIGDNVFVFEEGDLDAAQIEEAASHVNLAETRGFHNRPETQALVRSRRAQLIEGEIAHLTGGEPESAATMVAAIIAGGHLLVDGAPVSAATAVIQELAALLGLKFACITLTPESKPAVLAGVEAHPSGAGGAVNGKRLMDPFRSELLLADGLQRAPLETRMLLLGAMENRAIALNGETRALEEPFVVVATQTSAERGASYPLSEMQLDQFMFSLSWRGGESSAQKALREPILTRKQVLELQRAVREMPVSDHVVRYAVKLVRATRPSDPEAPDLTRKQVLAGAGARAAQHLVLGAKARAVLGGRLLVDAGDVRAVAGSVLRHRVFTNFSAAVDGIDADQVVARLAAEVPEPGEQDD